ncbi:MAG: flotillin family protein [Segniliparus sp.]|uniref:flotillin family protein n=1 Tax=Segniliparus sp. TaxID=2804064 RepID=UPI003F2C1FB4
MKTIAIVVVVAIAWLAILVPLLYVKVPPNKVGVFTGRGGRPKIVRGGARFRIPGFERVDYLTLEPLHLRIKLDGALSGSGVPVSLEAVGMVSVGASDEAVELAIRRFLGVDRLELRAQLNEILSGSLSEILARTTMEKLNADREQLTRKLVEEASADLARIGYTVDIVKIAALSDENGFLGSLGRKRIAEAKRDAFVGSAEAERDTNIQASQARQAGAVAKAEADIAIAQAVQKRDVEVAKLRAQVEAENAVADQAGSLASTTAEQDVLLAKERAEAARIEAGIAVQQLRAEHVQAMLRADVVAVAEAEGQAAIRRAEGQHQASILQAESQAMATRKVGEAIADARRSAAAALLAERQAEADGLRVLMQAEADGLRAKLAAEAEGKKQVAEALNRYNSVGARLLALPDVLNALVAATEAASRPIAALDRVSANGNAPASLTALSSVSPTVLAKVLESFKASGVDLSEIVAESAAGAGEEHAAEQPEFELDLYEVRT